MSVLNRIENKKGQIALLIDPDKWEEKKLATFLEKVDLSPIDYLFVGGSTVKKGQFESICQVLKSHSNLPMVGFPGDVFQYSSSLDALLYLSLLSGRNAEFLIGQHILTSKEISEEQFEVIPTAYLLIDGQKTTSVAYVSQTSPIPQDQLNIIERTAIAGKLQGKKLLYLDAGSGAKISVAPKIIESLVALDLPIVVGGGVRTVRQVADFEKAGANLIVIGNHLEDKPEFLQDLLAYKKERSQSLNTGS